MCYYLDIIVVSIPYWNHIRDVLQTFVWMVKVIYGNNCKVVIQFWAGFWKLWKVMNSIFLL